MARFFWNGGLISEEQAKLKMMEIVIAKGYDTEEVIEIFEGAMESGEDAEECRDCIFALSGYYLEIETEHD